MKKIRVSAVVLKGPQGVLMVRKQGTDVFMNPGGKPHQGESPADCAIREVHEELGLTLEPQLLRPLGRFLAPAANEAGFDVHADCFLYEGAVEGAHPAREIAEARWVSPTSLVPLAPLFTQHLRPLVSEIVSSRESA